MTARRLLLALAAVLLPAVGRAQPKGFPGPPPEPGPPPAISYEGTEVFRYLLQRAGLKAYTEQELDRFGPGGGRSPDYADTVVVVLNPPTLGWAGGRSVEDWIGQALRQGGAVVVADNSSSVFGPRVFGHQATGFSGIRVAAGPANRMYANRALAPFPDPAFPPFGVDPPEMDLFHGRRPLTRVAAVAPSTYNAVPPGCRVLARFPDGCRDATFNRWLAPNATAFAVGGSGHLANGHRPARFLAVADAGVFCNGLLVGADENGPTDNLEFADRAVKFLTEIEGTERKRTRCLFIENGRVVSNFDELGQKFRPPLPPIPIPPWDQLQPKIIDLGNKVLAQVQDKDIPNKLLVGPDPEHPQSRLRYLLAALLVMASLWAGSGRR